MYKISAKKQLIIITNYNQYVKIWAKTANSPKSVK